MVLKRLGRHAEAIENFHKALDLKAGVDVHRLLAESYEALGRLEESQRHRDIYDRAKQERLRGTWWKPVTGHRSLAVRLVLSVSCVAAATGLQGLQRGTHAQAAADVPQLQFEDITQQAGLDFRHTNGASPDKHIVETMGSGGLFLDYDNDGWLDVFLVDGGSLADARGGHARQTSTVSKPAQRHVRRRDGRPRASCISGFGMGACAGDYDNDGWIDLYVTSDGPNVLYRNGGRGQLHGRHAIGRRRLDSA